MASKYKLTYFPARGLAESIRFILSYGNVEFEDYRFEPQDWPSIKPSTPFGMVPMLEVDGKKAWQSIAICRYLGKQFGLAGKDDWENLQIDMAVDTVNDLRLKIVNYHFESDEAQKEKKKTSLLNEYLPSFMPKLENLVKENGGYVAAGKLTWADLYFVSLLELFNKVTNTDLLKDYPNLAALQRKVLEIPAIKDWVAKRPKTEN